MSNATDTTNVETTNTSAGQDGTNDNRRSDMMKQIKTFGRDSALGKDSLPKLAHYVVRQAVDGVITSKGKTKDGGDDASEIYAEYVKAESSKAIHEHSSGGSKANASKLRQLIALGEMTTIDPLEVMQAAHEARNKLVAANAEVDKAEDRAKLKAAYPFYVDVARAQQKTDTPLSEDTLFELAQKGEPAEKDLDKVLAQIDKLLQDLVSGERKDGIKDDDDLTIQAAQAIADRIKNLATLKAVATLRDNAKALGIDLA